MSEDAEPRGVQRLHPLSDNRISRLIPGDLFILDEPKLVVPIWGEGSQVLWSKGEPLMITGPQGVGKSTIAQQLAIARTGGIGDLSLLGFMVTPDPDRPVLYLALDRPRQIQRSMARMVGEKQRRQLHDGMIFHNGPLDFRVADKPQELLRYAQQVGAGTVVIDSLKDIASDLSNEGITGEINKALQYLVADGIEVVTVHHPRKLQQAASQARQTEPRAPTLDDVYGSIWITAGHGSVLFLSGQAGDRVVEMTHVKQPSDIVGPLRIHHDHVMGVSSVSPSLSEIIATAPEPMFVADIARMSCGRKPSRAETEKVRRHFESLDGTDLTSIPGSGRTAPTQWYRAQRQHLREAA